MRITSLGLAGAVLLSACIGAAAANVKDKQLQDLDVARDSYVLASKAFTEKDRARAMAMLEATRARAGTMNETEFSLALARIAALADNAHDGVHLNPAINGQRLPVRLVWFGQDLIVALSAPSLPELAGARLLQLGGKKVEELPAIARTLVGGPEHHARLHSNWLWESPDRLAALGFETDKGRVKARFQLRDGQVVERVLSPLDQSQVPPASDTELLRSERIQPAKGDAWHTALLGAPVPLAMQEPDKLFRAVPLMAYDALYVQFRGNYDRNGGRELGRFAGDTAALAMKLRPRFIVIDQRFNEGGNTDLTKELMKVLADAARDKVYIFVSEHTFSAGIVSSAIARQAAGKKSVLVGAPVGDRLRWWSENPSRCLPNSGHCFRPSYGLWDLQKGCAKEDSCFGDAYKVRIDNLDPDIAAPLSANDWLAGFDAALMAAAADAAKSK